MEFLAEIAVEVCWHVFSECCDQIEIIAVAVANTRIKGIVCI